MGSRQQVRRRIQEAVVRQRVHGHVNYSAIARTLRCHRSTVRRWAIRWEAANGSLQDKPRRGRPCKLDAALLEVLRHLVTDPEVPYTAAALARELGGDASATTITRSLHKLGFRFKRPRPVIRLTDAHKAARVEFATKWGTETWRRTVFTDSSYFRATSRGCDRWLPIHEANEWATSKSTTQVHVYGAIRHGGRSKLRFVTGTTGQEPFVPRSKGVGAVEYMDVVKECFIPFLRDGDRLQQDGAKAHTAKKTTRYLKKAWPAFLTPWPACSPDLNPIENVWGMMKHDMRGKLYSTVDELRAAVVEAWENVEQVHIDKCIDSLRQRLRSVRQAQGDRIGY
jgi:transposase